MDGTLNAYEQVLAAGRQGVIMESLETNALRALFQLYYQREEYRKSLSYMDRWEALTGRKDARSLTFGRLLITRWKNSVTRSSGLLKRRTFVQG